jgi:hypothetical protein
LTAVWEPKKFAANFYDGTLFLSSTEVAYGSSITIPAANLVKTGHKFLHWALSNGNELTAAYTMPAEDVDIFAEWQVKPAPAVVAPSALALTYNNSVQTLISEGSVEEGVMQYRLDEDDDFSSVLPEAENAGEYIIWYKADETENFAAVAETSLTASISKAMPEVNIETENDLVYNGSSQQLIADDGHTDCPGAMFCFEKDGTYTSNFVDEIRKTDAGEYIVWWRVEGNQNYESISETSLTVTILPATVTAAFNTDNSVEKDYDGTDEFTYDFNSDVTLTGVLSSDVNDVEIKTTSKYPSKDAAEYYDESTFYFETKPQELSFVLSGGKAENYVLSSATNTATYNVKISPVTLSDVYVPDLLQGKFETSKNYDGTSEVSVTETSLTVNSVNILSGESVTATLSGYYADEYYNEVSEPDNGLYMIVYAELPEKGNYWFGSEFGYSYPYYTHNDGIYGQIKAEVKFDINGHGDATPETQYVAVNGTATEPEALTTSDPYDFKYWKTSDNGIWNFAESSVLSNTTLYAHWELTGHIVNFYNGSEFLSSTAVVHASTVPDYVRPSKEGYYLLKWTLRDNSGDIGYNFNTPVEDDIELYAQWDKDYFMVMLPSNMEFVPSTGLTDETFQFETTVRFKVSDGYTVRGEVTSNGVALTEENGIYSFEVPARLVEISADVRKLLSVTFETEYGEVPEAQIVAFGETAAEPDEPVDVAHSFQYWQTESGGQWYFDNTVSSSLTLTAVWQLNEYVVNFYEGNSLVNTASVAYGSSVTPYNYTKTGHNSLKWMLSEGGEYNFASAVTGDLNLYAEWKKDTYRVTFDKNGYGGDSGVPETQIVEYGGFAVEPSDVTLTSEIHGFTGKWFTESSCENEWQFSTAVVTSDVTLYAQWQLITAELSYSVGRNAEIKLPVETDLVFETDNSKVTITDGVLRTGSDVRDGEKAGLKSGRYIVSVTIVEPLKDIEFPDGWINGGLKLELPDLSVLGDGYELYVNGEKVEEESEEVIDGEGEHAVVYEVKDPAGNTYCKEERTVKIDKSAPVTLASAEREGAKYVILMNTAVARKYFLRKGTKVVLEAEDLYSGIESAEYSWDGGETFLPLDLETLMEMKPGSHTLLVRIKDKAGNVAECKADFAVFDESKVTEAGRMEISVPVYYGSGDMPDKKCEIDLNGNEIFAVRDSEGRTFYGSGDDDISFENGILIIKKSYLSTIKPGENKLSVYINPLGEKAWNDDFSSMDYEGQILEVSLNVVYEVKVKDGYKFLSGTEEELSAFCNGDLVRFDFTLDPEYSSADYVTIGTLGVEMMKISDGIVFLIPTGALQGGNEPVKIKFTKDGFTSEQEVIFPGDYPSENNLRIYDDILAIDNSAGKFVDGGYLWYMDLQILPGESKQYLDLLKYAADGKTHTFFASVLDITGNRFRVCPSDNFTVEISKRALTGVKVYPNPVQSNQEFTLELQNFSDESLSGMEILIYNQLGTVVKKISNVERTMTMTLDSGFYNGVILVSGNRVLNFKIVVR